MATTASRPRRFSERVDRDIPSLGGRQRSWTAGGKNATASPFNGLVRLIEICHEGEESASHILTEPTTTIGREESCTVRIDAQSVSRNHCKIQYDENGQVWLYPLSDTNPTYINGEKIADSRRPLTNGDIVEMGRKFFRLDTGKSDKTLTPKSFPAPQLKQRTNSVPLPRTCSLDEKPTRPRTPQPKPSSKAITADEIRSLCHRRVHSLPASNPQWLDLEAAPTALPSALPKKNSIDLIPDMQDLFVEQPAPASPEQHLQLADDEEEDVFLEEDAEGLDAIRSVSSPIGTDLLARKVERALQRSAAEEARAAASAQNTPVVAASEEGGGGGVPVITWAAAVDRTLVSALRRELLPPPTAADVEAAESEGRGGGGGQRGRPWEEEEREGETAGEEYLRIAAMTVEEGKAYMRDKFVERMSKRSLYNRLVHSPSMGISAEELMAHHAIRALAGSTQDSLALAAQQLFDAFPQSSPSPPTHSDPMSLVAAARFPESDINLAPIAALAAQAEGEELPAMEYGWQVLPGPPTRGFKPQGFRDARMEARRLYNLSVYSPSMGASAEEVQSAREQALALGAAACIPHSLAALQVDVDVLSEPEEEEEVLEEGGARGGGDAGGREAHNQGVHSPSMGVSEAALLVHRILHHAHSEVAALANRESELLHDHDDDDDGDEAQQRVYAASSPVLERRAVEARMAYNKLVYSPSFGASREEWSRRFDAEDAAARAEEATALEEEEEEDCAVSAISDSDGYATIASATATPPEPVREDIKLGEEEEDAVAVEDVCEKGEPTQVAEDVSSGEESEAQQGGGGWWWPVRALGQLWRPRRS